MPMIRKTPRGFAVVHKDTGKQLAGPYPTEDEARTNLKRFSYSKSAKKGGKKKAKRTTVAFAKSKKGHGPVFEAMTRTAGNRSNPMAYPS